ncbi:AraC family transcriptional regulator [Bradyrhizobium sp. CER78]|nr:AraC family transcriptional regulator [Bradyrhizobium sp. CER78]MDH2385138.1 AraC family transcriptional regulator [Bradyrhizobium sp. CER78]
MAYAVGFNDLSYFHRSFRRKFGVAPAPAEMQMELGRRH